MKPAHPWTASGVVLVIGLVGALSRPSLVHAQDANGPSLTEGDDKPWNRGVSLERRAAAREVFLEGNRLFRVPLFAQATERYVEALRSWGHPAFYFNLALAQLNLGQEVEARKHLELAVKYGEEPLGTDEYKEARKQLQELERSLGQISIVCRTKGAEVMLDGVLLFIGPGSYRGWAKATTSELTAKKQGYLSEARRVIVSPGVLQEIELKLITLSEATDQSRRWSAWKPWTVLVLGGLIVASGGFVHEQSSSEFSAYDDDFARQPCASDGCTPEEIPQNVEARLRYARRLQGISVGSYAAGGSLIALGAVLLYFNRPRFSEKPRAALTAGRVSLRPVITGHMLGIAVDLTP